MTVRQYPSRVSTNPTLAERLVHEAPAARRHALERAYPLAKQLAEILELEDQALAEDAKHLRRRIAEAMAADAR